VPRRVVWYGGACTYVRKRHQPRHDNDEDGGGPKNAMHLFEIALIAVGGCRPREEVRVRGWGCTYVRELHLPRHDDGKEVGLLLRHRAALRRALPPPPAPVNVGVNREANNGTLQAPTATLAFWFGLYSWEMSRGSGAIFSAFQRRVASRGSQRSLL